MLKLKKIRFKIPPTETIKRRANQIQSREKNKNRVEINETETDK